MLNGEVLLHRWAKVLFNDIPFALDKLSLRALSADSLRQNLWSNFHRCVEVSRHAETAQRCIQENECVMGMSGPSIADNGRNLVLMTRSLCPGFLLSAVSGTLTSQDSLFLTAAHPVPLQSTQ